MVITEMVLNFYLNEDQNKNKVLQDDNLDKNQEYQSFYPFHVLIISLT